MDEIKVLDRFFEMLDENPDRAFYGWKHVCLAHANQAIEALMITDELFRCAEQGRM
jgi:protein pelota